MTEPPEVGPSAGKGLPTPTLATALAEALRTHNVLTAAWLACTCGWRSSRQFTEAGYFPWPEWNEHLGEVAAQALTAPGGWLDTLAGDEAVVEATYERLGYVGDEWPGRTASVIRALAAALRTTP